jgi:hypothetical protein
MLTKIKVDKMQNEITNIDQLTGMPVQYTTQPPTPSNELGNAKPVFNQSQQAVAQGIFGDVNQRQNSLGSNAPLFKKSCGSYKK